MLLWFSLLMAETSVLKTNNISLSSNDLAFLYSSVNSILIDSFKHVPVGALDRCPVRISSQSKSVNGWRGICVDKCM